MRSGIKSIVKCSVNPCSAMQRHQTQIQSHGCHYLFFDILTTNACCGNQARTEALQQESECIIY